MDEQEDILLSVAPVLSSKKFLEEISKLTSSMKPMFEKAFSLSPNSTSLSKSIKRAFLEYQEIVEKTKIKIGYEVKDKVFKNASEVASEISRITQLKDSANKYDATTINKTIKDLKRREQAFITAESTIKSALAKNYTEQERIQKSIEEQVAKLEELKQTYIELTTSGKQTKKVKEQAELLTQQMTALDEEIRKTQKSLDDFKPKKLTAFDKFFKRFYSYLNVRIFRNFFSAIERGLGDSLKNVAKFSPDANKALSGITSQFTILSNAVVSVIVPILQLTEPLIKGLTKTVVDVASAISYLIAKLSGSKTYLRANTEYIKEFNNELNKFSFDKFEALSGESGSQNMFIEDDISKVSEDTSSLAVTLGSIGTILAGYATIKIVKWILDGGVGKLYDKIVKLSDGLSGVGKALMTVGGTVTFVYDLYKMITEIVDLIQNWDSKSFIEKLKSVLKILVYGLSSVVTLVGLIKQNYTMVAAGMAATAVVSIIDNIPAFANGGMVDNGSLFVAGEAGAELVTTMPSGQTGVTNIAQFKQATLEALYTWWDEAKYDLPEGGSFSFDGAQVARSKSFISEMNRKNAGLNLK